MRNRVRILAVGLAFGVVLAGLPLAPARAQLDRDVADIVAASTVLLTALIVSEENGQEQVYGECFLGSGTVVSDDARVILTNSHVVAGIELAESFAESETAKLVDQNPGREVEVRVGEIAVWVVDHTESTPDRRFRAEVVEDEPRLDLAVLRVTGDTRGRTHERPLFRPHLELGSSSGAEAVYLFGYPAAQTAPADQPGCTPVPADRSIQRFPGSVSGFAGEQLGLLVVQTSASPGMSGGAAIDGEGRLIGVPAQIQAMAVGGVVEVIPVERARDLLQDIVAIDEPTPTLIPPTVTPILPTATPTPPPTSTPIPPPTPTSTPSPTATPSPTLTPPTPTPQPTPTPTPAPFVAPLPSLLPVALPLAHAACFRVSEDGEYPLDDLAARFTRGAEAGDLFRGWGFQQSVFRGFSCDSPPQGSAGYIYIGLHRFDSAASARQATDYFAVEYATDTGLPYVAPPAIGDYAVALGGSGFNGEEFTLYTSSGSLLLRITGVSPIGSPSGDVETIARAILDASQLYALPFGPPRPGSAMASNRTFAGL